MSDFEDGPWKISDPMHIRMALALERIAQALEVLAAPAPSPMRSEPEPLESGWSAVKDGPGVVPTRPRHQEDDGA